MSEKKNIIFKGEKLKDFLRRKGVTYKEASIITKLDKNTIGKFSNGGNMNIYAVLSVCNSFELPIDYFFGKETSYDISTGELDADSLYQQKIVNENSSEYKVCKNNDFYLKLIKSKDDEIGNLTEQISVLTKRIELLEKHIFLANEPE